MKQQTEDMIVRGKELLAALSDRGMPMSPAAWHNTGDESPANGQASREMRALHRATVAFSEALNSATNLVEKINKLAPDATRIWKHRFAQKIAAHYNEWISKDLNANLGFAYAFADGVSPDDFDKDMSPEDAADFYWADLRNGGAA